MADEFAARLDKPDPAIIDSKAVHPVDLAHPQAGWEMDGVRPVPPAVAARLGEAGEEFRLATAGHVLRLVEFNFPGLGPRLVTICEKLALVYLPENKPPYEVQGVQLTQLPSVLAAR